MSDVPTKLPEYPRINIVSKGSGGSFFQLFVSSSDVKGRKDTMSAHQIAEKLVEKYPLITIDNKVLGEPRLAGTRFAVSNVLTALTLYNSFEEVIDEYDSRYSEKQLKDAVRFARDFLDAFYIP